MSLLNASTSSDPAVDPAEAKEAPTQAAAPPVTNDSDKIQYTPYSKKKRRNSFVLFQNTKKQFRDTLLPVKKGKNGMVRIFLQVDENGNPIGNEAIAVKDSFAFATNPEEEKADRLAFENEARYWNEAYPDNPTKLLFVKEEDDDDLYPHLRPRFLMPFIPGQTLSEYQQSITTNEEALSILIDATVALQELHKKGIVHGDLKASNLHVIRKKNGECQIVYLDFGSAYTEGKKAFTWPPSRKRGCDHIAPERFRPDNDELTGRYNQDNFSFGFMIQKLYGERQLEIEPALRDWVISACLTDDPNQRRPLSELLRILKEEHRKAIVELRSKLLSNDTRGLHAKKIKPLLNGCDSFDASRRILFLRALNALSTDDNYLHRHAFSKKLDAFAVDLFYAIKANTS